MTTCGRNVFAIICYDAICCTSTFCSNDMYTQLMGEVVMFNIAKKGMVANCNDQMPLIEFIFWPLKIR